MHHEISAGLKFIVLTDPKQLGMDIFLKKIYELYSDFALKNPFYSLDMPIRYMCDVHVAREDYCITAQITYSQTWLTL